jgi:hypothetical protein
MIRLRVFHPGRHVWRLLRKRGRNTLEETWISLRRVPPDWERILSSTLDLIWLPNTRQPGHIKLSDQHGFIKWRESWRTTKIVVRLENFSVQKESLVAAALLKAARFHLLEEG